MDNFGYEIKQSISNFLTEMFPLSFLFHLSSTPRDRIRASPDPFSRVARVSPRKSPLSAVPVPPRWLKKQTLPRAQKKNERKRLVDIHKECRPASPVLSSCRLSRNLETYESSSTGPFFATRFATRPCVSRVAFVYAKRILFLLCAALNLWIYYGDFDRSSSFDNFFLNKKVTFHLGFYS